jgi:hypothetical protein
MIRKFWKLRKFVVNGSRLSYADNSHLVLQKIWMIPKWQGSEYVAAWRKVKYQSIQSFCRRKKHVGELVLLLNPIISTTAEARSINQAWTSNFFLAKK